MWVLLAVAAWVLVPLPMAVVVGRVFARGSALPPAPVEAAPAVERRDRDAVA